MITNEFIKKTICLIDERDKPINVNFIVKILDSKSYVLEIFDSVERYFVSNKIDYDYINLNELFEIYSGDYNIMYKTEFNNDLMKNDVWIEVNILEKIYFLNQKIDECNFITKIEKLGLFNR